MIVGLTDTIILQNAYTQHLEIFNNSPVDCQNIY